MKQREGQHLRYARLDEVGVGPQLVDDFTRSMFIENRHVLPQDCLQVLLLDFPCDSLAGVDKAGCRNVLCDEGLDGHVDKV